MLFKAQIIYVCSWGILLDSICKTKEKSLFWWLEDIYVLYGFVALARTVPGWLSLKLLEWKLDASVLQGGRCWEWGWRKDGLGFWGVFLGKGGGGHPDCLGQLHGRGWSLGDSRLARGSAGATDLQQKLKVVTFLFSNRTGSSMKEKGSSDNAWGDIDGKRNRSTWKHLAPSTPSLLPYCRLQMWGFALSQPFLRFMRTEGALLPSFFLEKCCFNRIPCFMQKRPVLSQGG